MYSKTTMTSAINKIDKIPDCVPGSESASTTFGTGVGVGVNRLLAGRGVTDGVRLGGTRVRVSVALAVSEGTGVSLGGGVAVLVAVAVPVAVGVDVAA
jgi:hypothetical protein